MDPQAPSPQAADAPDRELIATVQGPVEAEVLRSFLASYGIPVTLSAQVPHSVLPFSVDGLGEVQVRVSAGQAQEARDLISQHRRSALDLVREEEAEGGTGEPAGE